MGALPEGIYQLVSRADGQDGQVADVSRRRNNLYIRPPHGGDNQQFLFFETDLGDYYMIARHNGQAVDHRLRHFDRKNVYTHAFHGENNQRWSLKRARGGVYRVVSRHDRNLVLQKRTVQMGGTVRELPPNKANITTNVPTYKNGDLWEINLVGKIRRPKLVSPEAKPGQIPDPPRLTSSRHRLPRKTRRYVIGEALVPFMTINDDILSPSQQVKETPYYKLTREQFWEKIYHRDYSGIGDRTDEVEIEFGLVNQDNRTLQRTVNIEVGGEAGIKINDISGKFYSKIAKELKVSVSTTRTESVTYRKKITFRFPKEESARAIYVLTTRYTLYRRNGSIVTDGTWEYRDENYQVERRWVRSG